MKLIFVLFFQKWNRTCSMFWDKQNENCLILIISKLKLNLLLLKLNNTVCFIFKEKYFSIIFSAGIDGNSFRFPLKNRKSICHLWNNRFRGFVQTSTNSLLLLKCFYFITDIEDEDMIKGSRLFSEIVQSVRSSCLKIPLKSH